MYGRYGVRLQANTAHTHKALAVLAHSAIHAVNRTKIDRACELHSKWRSADFLQIRSGSWFEFLKFPNRRVVYRIKNYTSGKFITSGGK